MKKPLDGHHWFNYVVKNDNEYANIYCSEPAKKDKIWKLTVEEIESLILTLTSARDYIRVERKISSLFTTEGR